MTGCESLFPALGRAIVVSDGSRNFLIVHIDRETAEIVARGIARDDFTPEELGATLTNSALLSAMPGRIKRASV